MKAYEQDLSVESRSAEIRIKAARLQKIMEQENLAAIAITKSNNFAWITAGGNNIITRFVENGVATAVVARNGGLYMLLNNIEEARFIDEEMVDKLGFTVLSWQWDDDRLLENLRDIAKGGAVASDNGLPGTRDGGALVAECQYSLLDSEIARYLHLGRTFSKAMEEFLATLRPGDMEIDIAGRIAAALWKHEIEPVLFLVAGDERILRYRHCCPTKNRLKKRVMVSCNGRYKGFVTKFTRFVNFGKPDDAFMKMYRDTLDIENRMVAATTIGADDLDVYLLSKKLYAEKGWPDMWKNHHQGGPQGYTNGYYLITEKHHGIVRENQCYCYNPSITGAKTEDGFIATREGPLFLTGPVTYPKETAVIGGVEVERPGVLVVE